MLLCCLSDLTNYIVIIVVLNPLASGCENSHTIGPWSLCLLTVAQRIDGIGVHNVCIQVTVGMISKDVSTLLFELRKKSVMFVALGFNFNFMWISVHVLTFFTFACVGLA